MFKFGSGSHHRTMTRLHCAWIVLYIVLCGCVGGAKPLTVAPVDPTTVILSDYLPNGAVMLQRVTVEVCYTPLELPPSNLLLLDAVKDKAASIGGNLIRNISYNPTGLLSRCSFAGGRVATALAFHVQQGGE
jgi:hypothetical protein